MLVEDMSVFAKFRGISRIKRVTRKLKKKLSVPDVQVILSYTMPEGVRAQFLPNYVLSEGEPEVVIVLDARYLLKECHREMIEVLAHEMRHFHQYYFHKAEYLSESCLEVLVEASPEDRMPYAWREVDARKWTKWFMKGDKYLYDMPQTDSEIKALANFKPIDMRVGVLQRYSEAPEEKSIC